MLLTDPEFVRRLESLYLLTRKVLGGTLQADRRTVKKGSGVTFADYAEYSYGDDHRSIDWRVYARLESLLIKLFEVEEETTFSLMLDCSRSMATKLDHAKQLVAAIGYIGLHTMDRIVLYGMAEGVSTLLRPSHGRGRTFPFLRALENTGPVDGGTDLDAATRGIGHRTRRRGAVVVVSDFLFPGGFERGLDYLRWQGHEVFCIQVQDDRDRRWEQLGDVELECVETGGRRRVTVTPEQARRYEEAVEAWNRALKQACDKRGIGLIQTTPEVRFERVIDDILRRGGLVG